MAEATLSIRVIKAVSLKPATLVWRHCHQDYFSRSISKYSQISPIYGFFSIFRIEILYPYIQLWQYWYYTRGES